MVSWCSGRLIGLFRVIHSVCYPRVGCYLQGIHFVSVFSFLFSSWFFHQSSLLSLACFSDSSLLRWYRYILPFHNLGSIETFIQTTCSGIVKGFWKFVQFGVVQDMKVSKTSPLIPGLLFSARPFPLSIPLSPLSLCSPHILIEEQIFLSIRMLHWPSHPLATTRLFILEKYVLQKLRV